MNYSWNSNAHPISDIRDWNADKKLELRPDFQRKEVWTEAAKVMLIDTVLQDIPMPKIILEATIVDQRTYRKVIDGQQRIRAILSFLQDEFALETPYEGPYYQKKYSELDSEVQNKILQYKIDINEILNAPEEVIREMYSRVNKYNIPLNKQELRKADFPGKFLDISEKIAIDDFFEKSNIFTVANRRRMGDVEYSSELLSAFLEGIQDKKIKLDEFYQKYADLGEDKVNEIETEFKNVILDIEKIFDEEKLPINKTRFKQKADFYSLFIAVKELKDEGADILEKDLEPLRKDLNILDEYIMPESPIQILSEYAIKCVSQSNTLGSRTWRKNLLKSILRGTYSNQLPSSEEQTIFQEILYFIEEAQQDSEELIICWEDNEQYFQLSNAKLKEIE
ncbi:hypothetical protein COJ36_07125 [Priestia megaterium]|uniref:DUF262 domain-containing protein n=1 Tax=Priestia megaterium TaxID=1404 RepID=UPI000BF694E1|nr:DUF262 domain-containing protein [Priestia megaterium]PFL68557.1 hypothetical protein COJ36_07125 [Priestia megaterium]